MHYLISHQINHFPYLHITPRKKQLKHQLIDLIEGDLLVRLGKSDYLLKAPQTLWLPANCLVSISYLPNTKCTYIEISTRSNLSYPPQAGVLKLNNWLKACLEKLETMVFSCSMDEPQQALYTLLTDEIIQQIPQLNENTPTVDQLDLNQDQYKDLKLCLVIREALKRRLSGQSIDKIYEDLFQGDKNLADKMFTQITGQTLL